MCSTRSSDGTHPKFDFDDPDQCQICFGFNPFIEEPIEGEELVNDEEPSADSEDEETGNEEADNEEGDQAENSFRFKSKKEGDDGENAESNEDEEEDGVKTFELTRKQKLAVIHPKVKDWINACASNISNTPLEKDDIKWLKNADAEAIGTSSF